MGGILGGLSNILFGKPETPEPDWAAIENLLKLGIDENRYDQSGLFTSFNWDEGKDNLTQTINPEIQPGYDAFVGRVNTGSPGYPGAGRFQGLLDAYMSRDLPQRRGPPNPRERQMIERQMIERPPPIERPSFYRPQSTVPEEYI